MIPLRALVVDDDAVTRLVLCHMLSERGWSADPADDVPEALDRLDASGYDLVIADFHLPSGTGIDILDAVESADPRPAFVLLTGIIEHSAVGEGVASRISAQLTKPVSSSMLRDTLEPLFPHLRP